MGKKHFKPIVVGTPEEYRRINRSISRLEELERNGWKWVAVDRPHKNKKAYDRKRDRRVNLDGLFHFHIGCVKHQEQLCTQCD